MRPLFQLGPRLSLCAERVRPGKKLCDIGTDHAYLPIWLLKAEQIPTALACDVNEGPLHTAEQNAVRYHVEDRLSLRLSDGLRSVLPEEAEDIVIAGMGGELILRMVCETPWLQNDQKQLILQPMSGAIELRRGLSELGFTIEQETAIKDSGRVYTVMVVRFGANSAAREDVLYPFVGALPPHTPHAEEYAAHLVRHLNGLLAGAQRGRGEEDPEILAAAIAKIQEDFLS